MVTGNRYFSIVTEIVISTRIIIKQCRKVIADVRLRSKISGQLNINCSITYRQEAGVGFLKNGVKKRTIELPPWISHS